MTSEGSSAGNAWHGRNADIGATEVAGPKRHPRADRPTGHRGGGERRSGRAFPALAVVCAAQAALAMSLVWTNTAFVDEASYLWVGRLVLGHWLHGSAWPVLYGQQIMSGSPFIYPPLGGLASNLAGLAAARILSLAFMTGGTVLVYLMAARLFGRWVGISASALWAVSEPVLRLTFATFDPMSVFLVALSAWLVVKAGSRRLGWLVACSAAALGLACAAAYSGLVIVPVVIVFAFLVLLPQFGPARAWMWTALLAAGSAAVFWLLITVSGSWAGIRFTILNRQVNDYQPVGVIIGDIAKDSGLVIACALAGALIAARQEERRRAVLLAALGGASLVVPAAQLYFGTGWALDKHAAYGILFAAIAGGYACVKMGRLFADGLEASRRGIIATGACALAILAVANSRVASATFRQWPDAASYIAALRPVAASHPDSIYGSSEARIAEYYLPQGNQWWHWSTLDMSLDPTAVPRSRWPTYYRAKLTAGKYGVIALFYAAPPPPGPIPPPPTRRGRLGGLAPGELLNLASLRGYEPGVPALTRVLARAGAYRLIAVGPYRSATVAGLYAIWKRIPPA
jgi:hypothetical protein